MSQTAISTKFTLTVLTGTAGTTYDVVGRDANQVVGYRGIVTAGVPIADKVLTTSGKMTDAPQSGWNSTTKLAVPVMEVPSGGTVIGYAAQPKIAATSTYKLSVSRTGLMDQATALRCLDELAYSLLSDAKLRSAVVGFAPADA